jgi:polyisoprenoid-binding protein YceI
MIRAARLAALLLIPALGAATWARDPKTFRKDPSHSRIGFIADAKLHTADGRFMNWDADITFDPTAIEKTRLAITIDLKSVNTDVNMRDNDIRSCNFFCVDSFPNATFVSAIVNKVGENKLNITGDFTLRGHTKRITIPATLVFWEEATQRGRVKGQVTIQREDYGVSGHPRMNPVENDVIITFDVSFVEKK